ncbi:Zinc transporter 2 [Geodia barretti]|nr:Zinc transporter 2 [Geodia barretti]
MLITAGAGVFVNIFMMAVLHQHGHGHSHGGGGHGHGGGGHGHERGRREVEEGEERGRGREGGSGRTAKKKGLHNKNINVHAAFIHVVGDLIQSIGIVIAGYIIWFKPRMEAGGVQFAPFHVLHSGICFPPSTF